MKVCVYLPVPDGAPSDIGPHITLVYADGATGTVDVWRAAVEAALPLLPRSVRPTGDMARFGPEHDVPVALLLALPLAPAREAILAHVAAASAEAPQSHPEFRPHITVSEGQHLTAGDVPLTEVRLTIDGEVVGTWHLSNGADVVQALTAQAGELGFQIVVTDALPDGVLGRCHYAHDPGGRRIEIARSVVGTSVHELVLAHEVGHASASVDLSLAELHHIDCLDREPLAFLCGWEALVRAGATITRRQWWGFHFGEGAPALPFDEPYRSALLRLADVLRVDTDATPEEIVDAVLWKLVGIVDPDPLVRARDGAIIDGAEAILLVARWMRECLAAAGFGYEPTEALLSAELAPPAEHRLAPEGHVVGRPLRIARVGQVWDRDTGRARAVVTAANLAEVVGYFDQSGDQVFIDREHRADEPGGRVLSLWLVDGGQALAALPAYSTRRPRTCPACRAAECTNPRHEPMAEFVDRLNGNFYPSPHFRWGDMVDAGTRERLSGCRLKALALTTTPATAHRAVDEARLSEVPLFDAIYQAIRDAGLPEAVAAEIEAKAKAMETDGTDAATALVAVIRDIQAAATAASKAEAEAELAARQAALAEQEAKLAARGGAPAEAQLSDAAMDRIVQEAALRAQAATDPATFDPFVLPSEVAFGHAVRLGAWEPGKKTAFDQVHRLGKSAPADQRKALAAEYGLVPGRIPVEARLSSPGQRPSREPAPTAHDAMLKELGTGRAAATKLEEWDRTNDTRLRLFA